MSKNIRQQIALYLEDAQTLDVFISELRGSLTPRPSDADILEALRHSRHGTAFPALQERVQAATHKRLARRHAIAGRQRRHLTHKLNRAFWPGSKQPPSISSQLQGR